MNDRPIIIGSADPKDLAAAALGLPTREEVRAAIAQAKDEAYQRRADAEFQQYQLDELNERVKALPTQGTIDVQLEGEDAQKARDFIASVDKRLPPTHVVARTQTKFMKSWSDRPGFYTYRQALMNAGQYGHQPNLLTYAVRGILFFMRHQRRSIVP